jgi:hypothetical protein
MDAKKIFYKKLQSLDLKKINDMNTKWGILGETPEGREGKYDRCTVCI